MSSFERLTDNQLAPLLEESEYAFLPSKNAPNETATSLVEKFQNDPRYEVFGYIDEGEAMSYITALSGRRDDEIAIGPMYVAKIARGGGLGKRQILGFLQLFARQGYTSVYTKTWLGNAASRHCFESLGFAELDRKEDDRINGDSTVAYALELPAPARQAS